MQKRRTLIAHSKIFFRNFHISVVLIIFTLLLFNAAPSPAIIRTLTGIVTKVADGDTIHVLTSEQTRLKIRMYGIDAPETPKINKHTGRIGKAGQFFAEEASKALASKILGKHVRLDIIDIDRYRRLVSIIWLADRNINLEMISEGYAEAYEKYLKSPYRSIFLEAQKKAQEAGKGIWSQSDYERPKDYRQKTGN